MRFLSDCEKTPGKQEFRGLSYFSNTELFLEHVFLPLPGVEDRREFTSDHSSQVAIVCLSVSMEEHVFATCGIPQPVTCPCDYTLDLRGST